MSVSLWLKGMRPRTLPASVAPVVIGAAAAWSSVRQLGACAPVYPAPESCTINRAAQTTLESRFCPLAILCALVALFLQIAVNYANDYSDGVRGTDEGRGAASFATSGIPPTPARLVASGVPPRQVLKAAGIAAALACLCGLSIVIITGYWWLLAVGVCCLLAGWCYTGGRHPYGYAGLGELFVFVFFGLVAVLGTQFVLLGTVTTMGVLGAVQAGLLSCVLLMVNNLRDVDSDRVHGKRTLAVRLGERRARILTVVTYWVGVCPSMMLELAVLAMFAIHVGHYPAASYGSGWVIGLTGMVSLILAMLNGCVILGRDHARALSLTSLSLLACAAGYAAVVVN